MINGQGVGAICLSVSVRLTNRLRLGLWRVAFSETRFTREPWGKDAAATQLAFNFFFSKQRIAIVTDQMQPRRLQVLARCTVKQYYANKTETAAGDWAPKIATPRM